MSGPSAKDWLSLTEALLAKRTQQVDEALEGWRSAQAAHRRSLRAWGFTLLWACALQLALIIDIACRGWP